jgi:hypothetical protein
MGLPVSVDIRRRTHGVGPVLRRAFDWLRDVDARFSPVRPTSEVCRLDRGELPCTSTFVSTRVVTRGEPEPGRPWRVGVRHPELADQLCAVFGVRDGAVATSACYERAAHCGRSHRSAGGRAAQHHRARG